MNDVQTMFIVNTLFRYGVTVYMVSLQLGIVYVVEIA